MKLRLRALVVVVGAFVIAALSGSSATADVGVLKQSRSIASPGKVVKLRVACGSCEPGTGFPISMVPRGQYPEPYPCGNNALCTPAARKPPRRPPYVYLGNTETVSGLPDPDAKERSVWAESVLRFPVPRVDPGRYVLVIFCGGCRRGSKGSLITSPNTVRGNLRVLPAVMSFELVSSGNSESGGADASLWLVGGLTIIIVGFGLFLRRRLFH